MSLWKRHAGLAYAAVFVGVLGHASSEFVAVLTGVGGPELSVWRFLLGGIGLVILSLVLPASRDLLTPLKACGGRLLVLSVVGVALGYLMFHWSLDYATVPQVATLMTTIPIFVAIANLLVNKQPISTAKLLSGFAAVLGVALLVTDGYLASLTGGGRELFGIFLALVCTALVGFYTVMIRPVIAEHGALRITSLSMFIGGLALWLLVGLVWGIRVNPLTLFQRPPEQSTALLTIALWNTTITQFLWIGGLAAVPDITRGSYLFFLKPVIAALLTVLFLQQSLTWIQGLAILVIVSAVALEAAWPRLGAGPVPAANPGGK